MFLSAVSVPLIKVLTDLEKRRDAFFYRHLGPHGPKEGMPLHPESCAAPKPRSSCSSCSSWPSCFSHVKIGCNFGRDMINFNIRMDVAYILPYATEIRKR